MRCKKAMWWGDGSPAGLCEKPAYGATRFGWQGMPLQLACEDHGGPTLDIKKDGNKWCATVKSYSVVGLGDDGRPTPKRAGFVNLQESPAGFGDTVDEAVKNLTWQLNQEVEA